MKHSFFPFLAAVVLGAFQPSHAAPPQPATPPPPAANYQPVGKPEYIGLTGITSSAPVEVEGQPRNTKGHPCTLWDKEDIARMKELLKTNKELQVHLGQLKEEYDKVITQPLNVPEPRKGPDGTPLYPGDYMKPLPEFPTAEGRQAFKHLMIRDCETVSALGTLYALTGDAKYAEYARKLLVEWAKNYPLYGKHPGFTMRSGIGLLTQLLDEGQLLTKLATGYDLVYNLPTWTDEERKQVHDGFFQIFVNAILYPAAPELNPNNSYGTQENNRGALTSTGVLAAGYATDDAEWVNATLYGIKSANAKADKERYTTYPLPKDWIGGTKDQVYGGLIATHFGKCIGDDGMWIEGSPGYTLYASCGLVFTAEMLWHHGVDMYRARNGVLKRFFDYPMTIAYPDLSLPALNDSNRNYINGGGNNSIIYEYAFRRYKDPRFLKMIFSEKEKDYLAYIAKLAPGQLPPPALPAGKPAAPAAASSPATPSPEKQVANKVAKGDGAAKADKEGGEETPPGESAQPAQTEGKIPLSTKSLKIGPIGSCPVSPLWDLDPNTPMAQIEAVNANYTSAGFGINRVVAPGGVNSVIFSTGVAASHGHPDKLQIDLWGVNRVILPSPGVVFPYTTPANQKLNNEWFHTTLSHNTLTVDGTSQNYNRRSKIMPQAEQTVYGPASTMGLQRGWSNTVYPNGVTLDRGIFITGNYLADLFAAFSSSPHLYDLAWHISGTLATDLKLAPATLSEAAQLGYCQLKNVRSSVSDKPCSLTFSENNVPVRLYCAAPVQPGSQTELIYGDGGLIRDRTSKAVRNALPPIPTILERRKAATSTIYGNVLDLSGGKDPYIKGVTQEGDSEAGYALLNIQTLEGSDFCFVSYMPKNREVGGISTDASQALVRMKGARAVALYLGGGTSLVAPGGENIQRNPAGLAYVETTAKGIIVGNPSPADGTVTFKLAAINGMNAWTLDENEKCGPALKPTSAGGSIVLQMKANSRVLFSAP